MTVGGGSITYTSAKYNLSVAACSRQQDHGASKCGLFYSDPCAKPDSDSDSDPGSGSGSGPG